MKQIIASVIFKEFRVKFATKHKFIWDFCSEGSNYYY